MSLLKCDSVGKGEVCSCFQVRNEEGCSYVSSGKLRSHVFLVANRGDLGGK